jgi:adenylate cyclase
VAGRYGFVHGLYQQVLYDRLLVGQRTVLHRRLGARQEAAFGKRAGERAAVLSIHFERGLDYSRAVQYRQQAVENALQQYAYQEAIVHLTQALTLLQLLPETAENVERALRLYISLGASLINVQGYGSPAAEQAYTRAQTLCQQLDNPAEHFAVLLGLWRIHGPRGELRTAQELGKQLLCLAQSRDDPTLLGVAHSTLGFTLYCLGEFSTARHHMEQGLAVGGRQPRSAAASLHWHDARLECLAGLPRVLWCLGYPDQALQRSHDGRRLALVLGHPYGIALIYVSAVYLYQRRRQLQAADEHATATITLGTTHEFAYPAAAAMVVQGWVWTMQGRGDEGLARLYQGLEDYQHIAGAAVECPFLLALLAEAYGHVGRIAEGLDTVTHALTLVEAHAERCWEPELYRLRGVLLQQAADDGQQAVGTAEACLRQALTIAHRQQAKSLELRAAMSLARLWQHQGKRAEAYTLLAPIYGWFTEGLDTADLQEASALLQALGAAPAEPDRAVRGASL